MDLFDLLLCLMPTILLRKSLWNTSILWFSFSVSVHVPHWYRKILEMNASKYLTLSNNGSFLLVSSMECLFQAAEASPFLRLISLSVSNLEPSRIVFFHVLSPLWLIENFSLLSSFSVSPWSLRWRGIFNSSSLIRSAFVGPALQSSAYSCPMPKVCFVSFLGSELSQ